MTRTSGVSELGKTLHHAGQTAAQVLGKCR